MGYGLWEASGAYPAKINPSTPPLGDGCCILSSTLRPLSRTWVCGRTQLIEPVVIKRWVVSSVIYVDFDPVLMEFVLLTCYYVFSLTEKLDQKCDKFCPDLFHCHVSDCFLNSCSKTLICKYDWLPKSDFRCTIRSRPVQLRDLLPRGIPVLWNGQGTLTWKYEETISWPKTYYFLFGLWTKLR